MTEVQMKRLAIWKLTGEMSCAGCAFLCSFFTDEMYITCAKNKHPAFADKPLTHLGNHYKIEHSRCELYRKIDNVSYIFKDGSIHSSKLLSGKEIQIIENHYYKVLPLC